MIRLQLTDEDMEAIHKRAEECIERAGNGPENRDFGDGRHEGEGRVERNVEGLMAEKACANYYEVPAFQTPLNKKNSDGGVDIVVNDYNIDVKSTRHKNGHMPVKERSLKDLRPDIFFFCTVDVFQKSVNMIGWMWADEVEENRCSEHSPKGSHWVKQRKLRRFRGDRNERLSV
jgi:hypothetical protein